MIDPTEPKRYSLPRDRRVRGHERFDEAFKKGRRASSREALLLALSNPDGATRIGISVGRKFGNSPRRNRAKRLIREAFRLEFPRFPQGFDFVVTPRPGAFPDRLDAVRDLLVDLAQRALRVGGSSSGRNAPTRATNGSRSSGDAPGVPDRDANP